MFAHLSTRSAPYTFIHSRHAESTAQNETPKGNRAMSYAPGTSGQPFSAPRGGTGAQVGTKPLAAMIFAAIFAAVIAAVMSGSSSGLTQGAAPNSRDSASKASSVATTPSSSIRRRGFDLTNDDDDAPPREVWEEYARKKRARPDHRE